MSHSLQPLPYHLRLRDFLKENHREIWDWFSSAEAASDYSDAVQLELLKATYRLDRTDHESLYALADEVKEQLELNVPVTLYQSPDDGSSAQASLYYTPGHGHVVFGGDILKLLNDAEERALLGHELSHFRLWTESDGEFLVADRILMTMAGETRSEPSHHESARLYRLYTEIYCDRGSLLVSNSVETVVGTLMKTVTGMKEVNPARYLEQAEEIFARSGKDLKSGGFSHPEAFIRARSVSLWGGGGPETDAAENEPGEEEEGAGETEPQIDAVTTVPEKIESEIERMIEGGWALDDLDLTRQDVLTELTRELLRHLLAPDWTRTGRTLAHSKLYFSDFKPDEPRRFETIEQLAEEFLHADEKTRHYVTHVLLDFAVADRELDENGLALAFDVAEKFDIADLLDQAARKELKVLKRMTTKIRKEAPERLARAVEEHEKLSKEEKAAVAD